MSAAAVLEVESLRKAYGGTEAVCGASFTVSAGEIVGLLGPNGAGKTTTINMVLGILTPSAGTIRIAGKDVARERREALARANFAAVYAQLPGNLTVAENLAVFSALYGLPASAPHRAELLRRFDLEALARAKTGILSSGEQTRVLLAKAMVNDPALLLLDEPTASLDPAAARTIRSGIRAFAHAGGAVLWTSHNMQEVAEVCDRVLFLSHGRILLEGDPRDLPAAHGKKDLEELFIAIAREPLSLDI